MQDYDLPNASTTFNFVDAQNLAANLDATRVDLIAYQGVIGVQIHVGAPSNLVSVPKLNFVMQDSAGGTTFADVAGSNANFTNTNSLRVVSIDTRTVNRYLRVRANIADGNSPGWPVSVTGIVQSKYNPNAV
jgi:hypothetical protein